MPSNSRLGEKNKKKLQTVSHHISSAVAVTELYPSTHSGDCGKVKCYSECLSGDGFDRRCHACQTRTDCVFDQFYPDTCRPPRLVNTSGFDDEYKCRNVPNSKPSRIQCSEYQLCEHCKGECVWSLRERRCKVNVEHQSE